VVANSGSNSSLLFLFRDGCGSAAIKFNKDGTGSDAIYKVAVAHLWVLLFCYV